MILFSIAALVLALLAGLFVLWPLLATKQSSSALARNQTNVEIYSERQAELAQQLAAGELDAESHAAMLTELKLNLLDESAQEPDAKAKDYPRVQWLLIVTAILVPVLSGAWHWHSGAINEVEVRELMATAETPAEAAILAERLQQTVAKSPQDVQSWYLLARVQMELGRFSDATMSYLEVVNREPDAANVVAEMAQALFMASNNQMTPEVKRIAARALQLDANNTTALGLAGIGAFEQGDFAVAIEHWNKAMAQAQPGSAAQRSLQSGIERARQQLGQEGAAEAKAVASVEAAIDSAVDTDAPPSLRVTVSLANALQLDASLPVFVYARAWQGAKMPLAIQRLTVADLPAVITLDDSMAMMAGVTLSAAGQLEVIARVSHSGGPIAQSGDWQATQGPVSLDKGALVVNLAINSQIP